MITSNTNAKIKNIIRLLEKKKERKSQGIFVAEGLRFALETPKSLLREIYISESMRSDDNKVSELEEYLGCGLPDEDHDGVISLTVSREADASLADWKPEGGMESISQKEAGSEIKVFFATVSDGVMKKMSGTENPQGLLILAKIPEYGFSDIMSKKPAQILILEDIQDPGNLGTIIRTAEGAAATGIIATESTVDLFSPKASRATMGSIFRVPYITTGDIKETISKLQDEGVTVYAAYLGGEKKHTEIDCRQDVAFLIGNEGNGLKEDTAEAASEIIKIPMAGKLESLNAAMASGILMYEAFRQRGN